MSRACRRRAWSRLLVLPHEANSMTPKLPHLSCPLGPLYVQCLGSSGESLASLRLRATRAPTVTTQRCHQVYAIHTQHRLVTAVHYCYSNSRARANISIAKRACLEFQQGIFGETACAAGPTGTRHITGTEPSQHELGPDILSLARLECLDHTGRHRQDLRTTNRTFSQPLVIVDKPRHVKVLAYRGTECPCSGHPHRYFFCTA
jgi:hypothetical protein